MYEARGGDGGAGPQGWKGDGSSEAGLREEAARMKEQTRQAARETYDQVREFTSESMQKARQQWNESRGRVAERAREVVDQQKQRLCTGMHDAAEAARAAADKLEERQDQSAARYARMAGDGLEQVSQFLGTTDPRDMMHEAARFTRRHPEWVIGGMFLAGVAMARFLKADRRFEQRGLPEGADESLYRDVYRYQFDEHEPNIFDDSDDVDAAFGEYRSDRPGSIGGYNPSGSQTAGAGYGRSYGEAMSGPARGETNAGGAGAAGLGETMARDENRNDEQKGA